MYIGGNQQYMRVCFAQNENITLNAEKTFNKVCLH